MITTSSHHHGGLCMVSRGQRQYLIQLALRHQAHPHHIHLRRIETATPTPHSLLHLWGSIHLLHRLLLILKQMEMIVLITAAPPFNIPPMNLIKLTTRMIMQFVAIVFTVFMMALLSIHY